MKTRTLLLIFLIFTLVMGGLGLYLLQPGVPAAEAEIYSQGKFLRRVNLGKNQTFTVRTSQGGSNTITVSDGRIAVTAASCSDHYCMHRGWCNSGSPIICLPNALEIRFLSSSGPDLSVG